MGIAYWALPAVMVKRLTANESTANNMLNTLASEFSKGHVDLRTLNSITFDSVQLSKKIAEAKKICERMEKTFNGSEKK